MITLSDELATLTILCISLPNDTIFSHINCISIAFSIATIMAIESWILKCSRTIFCPALAINIDSSPSSMALSTTKTQEDKEKLLARLALFSNKIGVVKVGASTEQEERALRFYLGLIAGLHQTDMEIALPYFIKDYQAEENKFSIKQINSKFTKQIKSFFYKDCAKKYYILKKYKMAQKYFNLYVINGCVDFEFNTLLFILKSYIRPNWLINLYRKGKTFK